MGWVGQGAATLDRAFRATVLARRRRNGPESTLGPVERIHGLRAIAAEVAAIPNDADSFLPRASITPTVERIGRSGRAHSVRFASPHRLWFRPSPGEPEALEDRWRRYPENYTVDARWLRAGPVDAPVCLLLHGYLGGVHAIEERFWPIEWLHRNGIDAMLVALPFHGARRRKKPRTPPPFPGGDPKFTIEGFRQTCVDLRSLTTWLRGEGARAVGAMGMSLGGYSAALLATVEPLDFVAPFIPLASIADFARDGGRLIGTRTQQLEQHALLETIHAPVSPLTRPCLVPEGGRLVIAAKNDHITPMTHAAKIATHFDAPLEIFRGGHLLQFGRRGAFRAFAKMLHALELTTVAS